jgi:division protein CdvB (Snf7/Vps24/ESCRT-III family)
MSSLSKRWGVEKEQPFSTNVRELVYPPGPLKPRLETAARRIEIQAQKLDRTSNHFGERGKTLFNSVVDAYEAHDMKRANIFANELAEIRKMEQTTLSARLALEQILLRLRTATEIGGIVATLSPVIGVLQNVRHSIIGISPDVGRELTNISDLMSGIVLDAGSVAGMSINFNTINEDSQKILGEAAAIAEQHMKTKLPDLPTLEENGEEKLKP